MWKKYDEQRRPERGDWIQFLPKTDAEEELSSAVIAARGWHKQEPWEIQHPEALQFSTLVVYFVCQTEGCENKDPKHERCNGRGVRRNTEFVWRKYTAERGPRLGDVVRVGSATRIVSESRWADWNGDWLLTFEDGHGAYSSVCEYRESKTQEETNLQKLVKAIREVVPLIATVTLSTDTHRDIYTVRIRVGKEERTVEVTGYRLAAGAPWGDILVQCYEPPKLPKARYSSATSGRADGHLVMGVDLAKPGSDETVIMKREEPVETKLARQDRERYRLARALFNLEMRDEAGKAAEVKARIKRGGSSQATDGKTATEARRDVLKHMWFTTIRISNSKKTTQDVRKECEERAGRLVAEMGWMGELDESKKG